MQSATSIQSTPQTKIRPPQAAGCAGDATPDMRLRSRRWPTRSIADAPV
ncbi:hypothetical protein IHE31_14145 [Mycetohabitans rhizoxinica]